MRKQTALWIALIVFVVGGIGTGLCWHNYNDSYDRWMRQFRTADIQHTAFGVQEATFRAVRSPTMDPTPWRVGIVVLGAISLMGGLSAIVIWRDWP